MEGNKTIISKPPGSTEDPKAFTFDQSYWSADKDDDDFADQERVYNDLGRELLDHAFNGYNCCIFSCKVSYLCLYVYIILLTIFFNKKMAKLVLVNLILW